MLGRDAVIANHGTQQRLYVEARYQADFVAAMREANILVEYQEDTSRGYFQLVEPEKAAAATVAISQRKEFGYCRPRPINRERSHFS